MSGANSTRDDIGRFVRIRSSWTPDRWSDGYVDNKGRFRVYRPDCPEAFRDGYALRYHVVWWLNTGKAVPAGYDLHHKNQIKTDDRLENLELTAHDDHGRIHNPFRQPVRVCEHCGSQFQARNRSDRVIRFCSQACYHAHPNPKRAAAISVSLRRAYAEGRR